MRHNPSLWDALAKALAVPAVTVLTTDEDVLAAEREQWGTTATTTWPSPPVSLSATGTTRAPTLCCAHGIKVITVPGEEPAAAGRAASPAPSSATLVMAVMRAERPLGRLPAGIGPPGPWSPALLLAGLAASMFGLARLAIAGFAPGGNLPVLALAVCAAGLAATLLTGRVPAVETSQQALRPQQPRQPPKVA